MNKISKFITLCDSLYRRSDVLAPIKTHDVIWMIQIILNNMIHSNRYADIRI